MVTVTARRADVRLKAESGESANKRKGKERDGRKHEGESRNESRLEMS